MQKQQPIVTEEASLIEKFVVTHQSVYQLQQPVYKQLLGKVLENRLANPLWDWKEGVAPEQSHLRVFQCLRILTREESIAVIPSL